MFDDDDEGFTMTTTMQEGAGLGSAIMTKRAIKLGHSGGKGADGIRAYASFLVESV
jgi:hypothetical protein